LWIGASPTLREQPTILSAFLDDFMEIMRFYGDVRIETDEPCVYLDTAHGRETLRDSLARGNISRINIRTGKWSESPGNGYATIELGSTASEAMATSISLSIEPNSHDPIPRLVEACVDLIQRWFVPLGGAAAGFTHGACGTGNEGKLYQTQREREHGKLEAWDAILRYVRGTFWGTALGPDHCERLGGQARVLREAPAPIIRPLGEGVWLQLSQEPPAALETVERLAAYLAPLQQWMTKDATIHRRHNVPIIDRRPKRFFPQRTDTRSRLVTIPSAVIESNDAASVPMTILDKPMWGGKIGINVHLSVSPIPAQLSDLQMTLEDWFQIYVCDGNERFWPYGYYLDGPTVSGTTARWNADGLRFFGRIHPWNRSPWHEKLRQTLQPLSERLAALPNIGIEQMVIGRETIG
jgi:hypothetical protein